MIRITKNILQEHVLTISEDIRNKYERQAQDPWIRLQEKGPDSTDQDQTKQTPGKFLPIKKMTRAIATNCRQSIRKQHDQCSTCTEKVQKVQNEKKNCVVTTDQ